MCGPPHSEGPTLHSRFCRGGRGVSDLTFSLLSWCPQSVTRIWLRILVCCCGVVVPILICWVTIFSFAGSPVGWEAFVCWSFSCLLFFVFFATQGLHVFVYVGLPFMPWESQHRAELYQRRYKARPSLPATTFFFVAN